MVERAGSNQLYLESGGSLSQKVGHRIGGRSTHDGHVRFTADSDGPATLTVKDQKTVATVVWSSPNYDYMKVGEEKFLPVNQGGETSMFEIPVTVFDRKMAVSADTTAMSTPHEIEYTLQFDSASIKAE